MNEDQRIDLIRDALMEGSASPEVLEAFSRLVDDAALQYRRAANFCRLYYSATQNLRKRVEGAELVACYHCGEPYRNWPYDIHVSDEVWAKISPTGDGGGLLCASCLCTAIAVSIGSEEVRATIYAVSPEDREE